MIGNKEVEYAQAISYIHHMYETRHKAFHFMLLLNAAMAAIVFNSSSMKEHSESLPLAIFGFLATVSLMLFVLRNSKAIGKFEEEAIRIESEINFSLITSTNSKSIGGIHSGVYLTSVYVVCSLFWGFYSIYLIVNVVSN